MINWILTINRPEFCETKEFMVPRDKVTELLEDLLKREEWFMSSSITIKPTEMEYFDGRP